MTAVCVRGPHGHDGPFIPSEREQEIIDRFSDFLTLRAAIARRVEDGTYVKGQTLPPWHRYALRLCAWRMTSIAAER